MRKAPIWIIACAALFSYTLFSWGSWASDYKEAILNVEDCVNAHWSEFESRTGEMPSVERESEWRNDCAVYLSSTS